jgi:hypothetical protein
VRTVALANLTTVGGAVQLTNMGYLTASAISAGLPQLQSIQGQFYMSAVSWSGMWSQSALVLPELRSVGSWSVRQTVVSVVSCPLLTTINGAFSWYRLPFVRGLNFPSLTTIAGQLSLNQMDRLTNLCHFASIPSTSNVAGGFFVGPPPPPPPLVRMPLWLRLSECAACRVSPILCVAACTE